MRRRPKDPWIADEPRLSAVALAVASRALRRRPILVFGSALLVTVLVTSMRLRRLPIYEATLYFHMTEGDVQHTGAARPPKRVGEYIEEVVLNRQQLLATMEKFGLSPVLRKRNPEMALESMRDDVEIHVQHNDFIVDRGPNDPPRAADITLSFRSGDARRSKEVAHHLGDVVLKAQNDARGERLRQLRTMIGAERDSVQAELRRLQQELDRLWLDAGRVKGEQLMRVRIQVGAVQDQMRTSVARQQQLDQRMADIEFAERAESEKLGLQLILLDEDLQASGTPLTPVRLALLALAVFMIAVSILAIVVGGFDNRVYRTSDLEAQGIAPFGEIPRFAGDDVGSYRARTLRRRLAKRV